MGAGWQFLKDGPFEKGSAIFSLVGTGLLVQIGWIVQGLEILVKRNRAKWFTLVDSVKQKDTWNSLRHDAAHFIDRIYTIDHRGNDPDTDPSFWNIINPDLDGDFIQTGNTTLIIPEMLAEIDAFLSGARAIL